MPRRFSMQVALPLSAVVLALTLLGCGANGNDEVRPASASPAEVLEETRTFIDTTRSTPANGTEPASDHRELVTRLWYAPGALNAPACRGDRCALLLLAHGFGGNTMRFDAIARLLASAGYIVVAPAFPLTNDHAPGGHLNGFSDGMEQPADVSFVLDEMLAANDARADPLYGRIDAARIGVVGHSLGGTTVLGATRVACCTDARIDAVVLVAPAAFFVPNYFDTPAGPEGPPTLLVNGSDDVLILPQASLEFVHTLDPPWYFLEIAGVGHVFLIENIGDPQPFLYVTARAATAFFDEYLGAQDGATVATLNALVAEGEAAEYAE